ncbi:hypothetical protein H5P28_19225 [Ruficoccus amylovorans]|uniref:YtxH domain-containing protein n=1 Tax=Ruficoccus amylovorans TaxID=1804625 RepID=A0A842HLL0_9BACT|nr:hypothetical protein [Ruficoccus amylovorans]MBC2596406.1 hypothetical protein [Ruficoccus amylovorans]
MKSLIRFLTALTAAAALTFAAGCSKDAKQDMKDAGDHISEAADKTGDAISKTADQTGDAIKDAYDDTKEKVKDATE